MIQRIQTIWLLLVAACASIAFFLPYGMVNNPATGSLRTNKGILVQGDTTLLALTISLIAGALITIFLYKNRKLQKTLCLFILLESLICIGLMLLGTELNNRNGGIQLGVIAPGLAFVFAILAYVGIQKDDKLVKNLDRLR